eukprot:CAMPEP_0178420442 /NCGR_PEP_ID=MMETSP0689_2-20121128/26131_1 /TAXON_ID=160604 /ORGANISM="Amphidinium massartii, Strain CS-259" /LENGTH=69 /DNA_ID=CAMNT_0020041917 /DNA_START=54 /DNA_END=260 /DNA_ORIENTATION=+
MKRALKKTLSTEFVDNGVDCYLMCTWPGCAQAARPGNKNGRNANQTALQLQVQKLRVICLTASCNMSPN